MTGSSLPSRAAWVRLRPNWSRTSEPAGVPSVWPPTPAPWRLLALVAGEQLDDLLAHPVEVGAELDEHLGGDALALADEAEQDVLGPDVVVAELQRLAQAQLQDLLRAGREGDVAGRGLLALADDLLDLLAHGVQGDPEALQSLGGDAFALVDQAEQDVLGPDVVVVEHARFLLRKHDHPAGPVGEPFEHRSAPRYRDTSMLSALRVHQELYEGRTAHLDATVTTTYPLSVFLTLSRAGLMFAHGGQAPAGTTPRWAPAAGAPGRRQRGQRGSARQRGIATSSAGTSAGATCPSTTAARIPWATRMPAARVCGWSQATAGPRAG